MVSPFKVAREASLDRSAGAAKFLGGLGRGPAQRPAAAWRATPPPQLLQMLVKPPSVPLCLLYVCCVRNWRC
jgi:hypothetical protein